MCLLTGLSLWPPFSSCPRAFLKEIPSSTGLAGRRRACQRHLAPGLGSLEVSGSVLRPVLDLLPWWSACDVLVPPLLALTTSCFNSSKLRAAEGGFHLFPDHPVHAIICPLPHPYMGKPSQVHPSFLKLSLTLAQPACLPHFESHPVLFPPSFIESSGPWPGMWIQGVSELRWGKKVYLESNTEWNLAFPSNMTTNHMCWQICGFITNKNHIDSQILILFLQVYWNSLYLCHFSEILEIY
jgi:hypothetical protein